MKVFRSLASVVQKIQGAIALGSLATLLGCHSGGDITASPTPPPVPPAKVSKPTIANPAASPYYSNGDQVILRGMCETGVEIELSGAESQAVVCRNSEFIFALKKSVDGVHTYYLTQRDPVHGLSEPTVFVWIRKSSVAPPNLTKPATAIFPSAKATLAIEGSCESGALISLTGDGIGYTTCLNSQFSLNLPKTVDGDYQIGVQQTDLAGNIATTNITWKKHAITLSPGNASVVVNTSFSFTINGGSGFYDVTLAQNHSGGNFDSTTKTYTSGTVANTVDILRVTDSQGTITDFNLTTLAGNPDHLTLISDPNPPPVMPGSLLTNVVEAHLVDRYGNGIASYPLSFIVANGDAEIVSNGLQVTDMNGNARVSVRVKFQSLVSTISVQPTIGVLPDLASSGGATVQASLFTETNNNARVGATYLTGSNPGAMVTADFNNDGKKDLAVLNVGDSTVGIFLNSAAGIYSTMVPYPTNCSGSNSVAAGDINGDTKLDLVIACGGDNGLVFLLGDGSGHFGAAQTLAAQSGEGIPMDVKLLDWNGDSKLDIAFVASLGGVVAIYLGNGNGGFAPTYDIPVGSLPNSLEIVDLNKDGLKDLVVLNSGNPNVGVLLGLPGNSFSAMTTFTVDAGPVQLKLIDADSDGFQDVLVCNNGANNVTLWMNDHLGGLQNDSLIPVGASPTSMLVGDLDGNGKDDIVVVNSGEDSLSPIMNRGGGILENLPALAVMTNPLGILGTDYNSDGVVDLVVNSGNQIFQLIPGRSDGLGYKVATGLGPSQFASGDFNNDGKADVVVVHSGASEIAILLGRGDGLFTSGTTILGVNSARSVITGDWNKDGKTDFIVSLGGTSSLRIYLGKGDGTFQPPVDYAVGSGPLAMASSDFNRDGYLDIATTCQTANSVTVLLGNGNGTFSNRHDFSVGSSPVGIATGDLSGDHIPDIVTVGESSSSVDALIGSGDGTFQPNVSSPTGNGPNSVVLQDFSGDGSLDIATLNGADASVSLFLGNGDGSLRPKNDYPTGLSPSGLVSGDFDSNGRLDVAFTNSTDQKLTVLMNSGGGALTDALVLETKAAVNGIITTDVNNDGNLDLITAEGNNNQLQIWVGH